MRRARNEEGKKKEAVKDGKNKNVKRPAACPRFRKLAFNQAIVRELVHSKERAIERKRDKSTSV